MPVDTVTILYVGLLVFGLNGMIFMGMRNTHAEIVRERKETNRLLMKIRMNKRGR